MNRALSLAAFTLGTLLAENTARAEFQDSRVQAPSLAAPERGSVVGQLASVAFGAADVSRGAFSLPSPLHVATDRGEVGAPFLPTYAPDQGQTEWGMGWRNELAITRWRVRGQPAFDDTDGLVGPWGTMVRGTDGAFYPTGLRSMVRVTVSGDTVIARLADGSTWTFGGASRDQSTRGTFAWYLMKTESVTGSITTFTYTRNASGRLFLSQVDYGGSVAASLGHRVVLTYERLPHPLVDYRSGDARMLDQRVSTVAMQSRSATTGQLVERWRESLAYQEDTLGPAFYLKRVQRTFASGEAEPPITYGYDLVAATLPTATGRRATKLDALLAGQTLGASIVNVARSAVLDVDADGRPDVESAFDNTLWTQTDAGYVATPLPPASATASPFCRTAPDPSKAPRTLAELRPGDPEHYVVSTFEGTSGTTLVACTRAGEPRSTIQLPTGFTLSGRVRLADVDGDQRPDLVRMAGDGYDIAHNTSSATAISFDAPKHGVLTGSTGADPLFVIDLNGDGLPDLVALGDSGVRVWYGRGNLAFDPNVARLSALTQGGGARGGLSKAQVVFADVNKDGLADMLVGATGSASLLLNTGSAFQQTTAPGLIAVGNATARPYLADWVGSGDAEVAYVVNGAAYSIALDRASSGLLAQADDGAGTTLSFTYERAPAAPGLRQRLSVLRRLDVQSTGLDPMTYEYAFEKPRTHTEGRFFLGFEGVTRRASLASQALTFFHGDTASGVLLGTVEHDDLSPNVEKVTFRAYDDVVAFGVPWKRPKSVGDGYRSTDPAKPAVALDQTDYLQYDGNNCPAVTRATTRHGTLTTTVQMMTPARLVGSLACLPGHITMDGAHADAALNFHYEAQLARNDAGQLTELLVGDGHGAPLVDQDVIYTPDGHVASVASPGRGVTLAEYDPTTRLLTRMTTPDGIVREVTSRDPLTDTVNGIVSRRGTLSVTASYRSDGRERLWKAWSDATRSSEARPESTYTYRQADATRPAMVRVASLVDGTAGVFTDRAELQAANGQSLVTGTRIPEGWALNTLTARHDATRETDRYRSAPVADITAATVTSLMTGAGLVGHGRQSIFGDAAIASELFHAGVERTVVSTVTQDADLTRADVENGAFTTRTSMDPSRRVVATVDAAGARTGYTYDALGRLRRVKLADGATHSMMFDAYAHPSRIERSGVGAITYAYEADTGLLAETAYLGTDGQTVRRVAYRHDGVGRVSLETHTDATTGRAQSFAYYYDGAAPENPSARDRTGLLTAVSGASYARHIGYRGDGEVVSTRIDVAGYRAIEQTLTYDDDGVVHGTTRVIRDANGAELLRTQTATTRDAYGRPAGESLEGAQFLTYAYDIQGLPAWAQFASSGAAHGEIATFQHDPLTRAQLGMNVHAATWSAATSERMSARGLVASEDLQVGAASRHRVHEYGPAGFLARSTDGTDSYGYGYDAAGLPARTTSVVSGLTEDRVFARAGAVLTAGTHHHTFDTMGRVVERDDVRLTYGPLGQVERAARAGQTWSYVYDESGQRVAKLSAAGAVLAIYLADAYLDDTSLTTPVRAAGSLVGALRQPLRNAAAATFMILPVDARGTVLSDADGTLRTASPFGDRARHPDVAAALDYASKGWDADLGVVRMGVRDYDPAFGRWLQPDPLYLAEPSRCVGAAVDCSLYAYVKNDPLRFVDPTGTQESPAAMNFINWRDEHLMKGDVKTVEAVDKFRIVGAAVGIAAAGASVLVAEGVVVAGAGPAIKAAMIRGLIGGGTSAISGAIQGKTGRELAWQAGVGAVVNAVSPGKLLLGWTTRGAMQGAALNISGSVFNTFVANGAVQYGTKGSYELKPALGAALSRAVWGGLTLGLSPPDVASKLIIDGTGALWSGSMGLTIKELTSSKVPPVVH